jgi:phage-related protein
MAVIKYEINGKANTKPIKETETSVQGLFKKVEDVDNKLKAFVGVKIFSEVGKAINNSLKEYDKFQASIGGTNITKQFDSLKTALSGTLGTIRDEAAGVLDNIFGGEDNNFLKPLEEAIPKIGAGLIASIKIVEKMIRSVVGGVSGIANKEAWSSLFTNLTTLSYNFGNVLAKLLEKVFTNAPHYLINGFLKVIPAIKGMIENIGIMLDSATRDMQINTMAQELAERRYIPAGGKSFDQLKQEAVGEATKIIDDRIKASLEKAGVTLPAGQTLGAVDLNSALEELGRGLKDTFFSLGGAVTGTDVSAEFDAAFTGALDGLTAVIEKMKNPPSDSKPPDLKKILEQALKDAQDALKGSLSAANKGFSDAEAFINNILGNAAGDGADLVREKINALNLKFQESTKKIDGLFEALKKAESADKVTEIFNHLNAEIENINNLAGSMGGLEKEAKKAKTSFDLLQGVLQSIGEMGAVVEAVMTSNWIGLIITLIGGLADVFGRLSAKAAAAQNILTVFFDALEEAAEAAGPALDALFEPLLDIFTALGRAVGALLAGLLPAAALVTQITDAFSLLTPALNLAALIIAGIADAVAAVWNRVASVIEKVSFGLIRLERMQTGNYQRMVDSINAEQNYEKYQDNSTSYSVAGDMYIYITYSHSYVNGDARNIALSIRDEIRLAEKSGY